MAAEQLAQRAGSTGESQHQEKGKHGRKAVRQPADTSPRLPEPGFDHHLATNEFGHYCIPDIFADNPVARTLDAGGVHESATLNLIRRKLGRGDVITGGTGLGDFLPALNAAVISSAVVHAFEPDATACAAAAFTIRLNGLDNVRLHPVVAGKRERDLPMPRLRGSDRTERRGEDALGQPPAGMAHMQRLDQIVPADRYVSVIHIESEGLEMPAILGGKRIVQDSAPIIILKAPRHRARRFFLSTLEAHFPDHRYRIAGTLDDNCVYVPLTPEN